MHVQMLLFCKESKYKKRMNIKCIGRQVRKENEKRRKFYFNIYDINLYYEKITKDKVSFFQPG